MEYIQLNISYFKKDKWYFAALFILLLPLFYINVKSTHDWGDDFAQYINEAKNIGEHKNITNTHHIFIEGNVHLHL